MPRFTHVIKQQNSPTALPKSPCLYKYWPGMSKSKQCWCCQDGLAGCVGTGRASGVCPRGLPWQLPLCGGQGRHGAPVRVEVDGHRGGVREIPRTSGVLWSTGKPIEKTNAKGGMMHLTSEGCRPEAVRCIGLPDTLGFSTQPPGEVIVAILKWRYILYSLF